MAKHLIITADDFGLAPEVNEAVETAHRKGILSAASLMVGAPAAADAVARAKRLPGLRVGLHLALVEAPPCLASAEVPDLIDATGWLRSDTAAFGAAIFFRAKLRRQIAAEIEAQFEAFRQTGLELDHVNAHQHFHLHPTIVGLMIRVGRKFGMRSVRLPAEPTAIVRTIDPSAPRALSALTAPWTALLGQRLRWAGYQVPDRVFGLAWTGAMTGERIERLIERLPDGVTEIYTHPAIAGGFTGAAPGYRYAEELAGLLAPPARAALDRSGASLGGFVDAFPRGGVVD